MNCIFGQKKLGRENGIPDQRLLTNQADKQKVDPACSRRTAVLASTRGMVEFLDERMHG